VGIIATARRPQVVDTQPVGDLRAADVYLATSSGVALRGSRCTGCAQVAFPSRPRCTDCQQPMADGIELPSEGSLYAFSTVHVSSSRPTPYTLGFVDLPGDLRVLARLVGPREDFSVGDRVCVAIDEDGEWGFQRKTQSSTP
jgi:uncharacterized OB-fold protein